MNKIHLLLFIFVSLSAFSQKDWVKIDKEDYSIEYPNGWQLDTSGRMNTKFIVLSKRLENDPFRENVNLIIQDLSNQILNLDSYTELSKGQISAVPNSKIIESKKIKKNKNEFYEIIWKGFVNNKNLKFKQLYFIEDNKAHVLTLTCEEKEFDKYLEVGTKILNSFTIK